MTIENAERINAKQLFAFAHPKCTNVFRSKVWPLIKLIINYLKIFL